MKTMTEIKATANRMRKTLALALRAEVYGGEWEAAWYRLGALAHGFGLNVDQMLESFNEQWQGEEGKQAAWCWLVDGWHDANGTKED